jgi:tripartite-type tricarboxylate transporter receptor subunit TctC
VRTANTQCERDETSLRRVAAVERAAREHAAWLVSNLLQGCSAAQLDAVAASTLWGELVQAGQLRLLVSFGTERIRRFAFAPTLREVGIDIAQTSPYGLVGPRGMPAEVVRRLHDAFKEALFNPEHDAVLDRLDMPRTYLGSADYLAAAPRILAEQTAAVQALGLRM